MASKRTSSQTLAKQDTPPVTHIKESTGSASKSLLGQIPASTPSNSGGTDNTTTQATSFGPTLDLKLILEGRPPSKMASKIFVGIADAASTTNLKYLLSFNIDLPDSGLFKGLSLAGLTTGSNYQAVIKGPAQIATSSAFLMSATVTSLNNGQPLTLTTGDLNEDNAINSADYSIAKAAYNATPGSAKWNDNIDFNRDGIINSADIAIIIKNMTKTGNSGLWVSPPPATKSASLVDQPPIGSADSPEPRQGYWLFVPVF